MTVITREYLKSILHYDRDSGLFRWKVRRGNVRMGTIAGTITSHGYVQIVIDRKIYQLHRLVWLYVYGEIDNALVIEHIDGNRTNNRFSNLRLTTCEINQQNQKRPQSGNTSGYLGVSKIKNRWQARIVVNGKSKYLGLFKNPQDAYATYLKAKRELHIGCTL